MKPIVIFALVGGLFLAGSQGQGQSLPELSFLRAEEDYSELREQELPGFLEKLKFIPLGQQSYLSVGGEARYLTEYFRNNGWTETSGTSTWLLQRYLLHTDWHANRFRAFVQWQLAYQSFTEAAPRGIDVDRLDLYQGFLEYQLPLADEQQLTARVGRQEFWLGSRRLVSVREGPNVRLSFDAARLYYNRPGFRIDGIYALRVQNEFGVLDNPTTDDEQWWGLYSVTDELVGPLHADIYYLGFYSTLREYEQGPGRELRHSVGTRLWKNGKLSVNAEVVYQFGDYGEGDINAYTVSLDLSRTTLLPLRPVFGLKTEVISGDNDPGDPDLQTFNALYPRGAYFGLIALVGPANLIDIHPSVGLSLTQSLSFTLDWDFFWRYSTSDGVYGPNIALERSSSASTSRYIGHQPGFEIAYEPCRYWSLSAEGSYFLAEDFFKETGSSQNVLHLATTIRFKF